MAFKDVNGRYWLQFTDNYECSQCNKPILDGEKIFIDATGLFHQKKSLIEMEDVCIYHYDCMIEGGNDQGEPTKDDYM